MNIKRIVGASLASVGMVVGLAGIAAADPGSGSIDTTGAHSFNSVWQVTVHKTNVSNDNNLSAHNNSVQQASSGDAGAYKNVGAGGAGTGNASNSNSLNASATVNNTASTTAATMPMTSGSGSASGSISTTGYKSVNTIGSVDVAQTNIDNDNNLQVSNNNVQTATSGDATVAKNVNGGSATTGNASNTNATTITFSVSN